MTEGEIFCGKGHIYNNEDGNTYIEFHVDDSEYLTKLGSNTQFGGYLSVQRQKNQKPLIIFGQDECIFKQYIFRNKCWMGPNGETPLTPKDEGQGLMVSGIVSREYGFNWNLSETQLEQVNDFRKDQEYIDKDAAVAKNGSAKKTILKASPFRRDLVYGANNEGYWTYKNMILQVEDCIDTLKAINGEKYQYLFLFDHSNSHDRAASNALKPEAIRKLFGGKQPAMRNTLINDNSYIGPHNHPTRLKAGDTQKLIFQSTDPGPYYLSHDEQERRRFDRVIGTKKIKHTKPELIVMLAEKGVRNPKGGTKKLQKICKANKIPITQTVPDIEEGWTNKSKGALQLLYERGWIDPTLDPQEYTMKGRLDEFGNRNIDRSLKSLISQQPDFMHEQTMLQYYCEKLGIKSDQTPVAHCEIAGEGIKFDWGCSKLTYRAKPISLKHNKNKFHKLVDSFLGKEVLSISVCRANAQQARQYMLTYATLAAKTTNQNQSAEQNNTTTEAEKPKDETTKKEHNEVTKMTHSLIEKCVGLYRRRRLHRNVRDFDGEYIKTAFMKDILTKMSNFPKTEPS